MTGLGFRANAVLRATSLALVLTVGGFGTAAQAAFEETALRYLSGSDLIEVLFQTFPAGNQSESEPSDESGDRISSFCSTLMDENRAILGDSVPATGRPLNPTPTPSYLRWYSGCLLEFIRAERGLLITSDRKKLPQAEEAMRRMLPASVIQASLDLLKRQYPRSEIFIPWLITEGVEWKRLPPELKRDAALHLVHRMIGPGEIVAEYGFIESDEALARVLVSVVDRTASVKSEKGEGFHLSEAFERLAYLIAMRDEFLSY